MGSFTQFSLSKIVIPDGVERLEDSCFGHLGDKINISLPSSIKYVGNSIFTESGKERVIIWYDGTIKQWNSIEKDEEWTKNEMYTGLPKIIVECRDGYLKYNF